MNTQSLERELRALANNKRLNIIAFLKKPRGASVGDIAEHIKLSFKSTSHHLRLLESSGILALERRGSRTIYRLSALGPVTKVVCDFLK